MLNKLAQEMQSGGTYTASSHLFTLSGLAFKDGQRREYDLYFDPDICITDSIDGYDVRIDPSAFADLRAWVRRSARLNGHSVETGGHLFGERDDAAQVIWVSEASGPPPDSRASPSGFICGFEGAEESSEDRRQLTRGAVRFVGMWHTHPKGGAKPSPTDYHSMRDVVESDSLSSPRSLLLILGGEFEDTLEVASALFSRGRVPSESDLAAQMILAKVSTGEKVKRPRDAGLALSGGGSRAIAFHLGCIRALHDRDVLNRIQVISGVSGGSVLTAMYAYSNDHFVEFDARVQRLLREGLQGKILRRFLLSRRLPQTLTTWLISGTTAIAVGTTRSAILFALELSGLGKSSFARWVRELHLPIRRWVSRTHAFEDALRHGAVGEVQMTSPRRNDVDVVINATELRTGSAFRFGSKESGIWRFGSIPHNDVKVVHAVAASAAYPILLPAFDEIKEFVKAGKTVEERVLLADGGVYDNLGTTCLEPDRSEAFSYNVYRPRYIICCDAGRGLFDDDNIPYWWPKRVIRAAESVFRKAQDRARARLFQFEASGQIKGFILSYLGTLDSRLPTPPPDLVRRDEVATYPTDFAPMRQEDIDRLALRGEQITRMLISRYLPEL